MTEFKKLNKEQLASRLGVSVRQLDYLVRREDLPKGKRKGRQLVWLEEVVVAWKRREFAEQLAWAAGVAP